MNQEQVCFFAYPSQPNDLNSNLALAQQRIASQSSGYIKLIDWKSLRITGKFLIREICAAIDSSEIFACDLTYLNSNVLFELGYAMAKRKRIWIARDTTIATSAPEWGRLTVLKNIGWQPYRNVDEFVSRFIGDILQDATGQPDILDSLQSNMHVGRAPTLVYLKCAQQTEEAVQLTRRLSKCSVQVTVDDPSEVSTQTLSWYVDNLRGAVGVIAHMLGENRDDSQLRNKRYSLIMGLAYGLGIPTLTLAHSPFDTPIDYAHLLMVHKDHGECIRFAEPWIEYIESKYKDNIAGELDTKRRETDILTLAQVRLGDHLAENEEGDLPDYFVETAAYHEALQADGATLFVGRKGTGKTANFVRVAGRASEKPSNFVCVVRPVDYQIEGIQQLFAQVTERSVKGNIAESLWKFLIYTELALQARQSIVTRAIYVPRTPAEEELVGYLDRNAALIDTDFAVRVESAVERLSRLQLSTSPALNRLRISEALHETTIEPLRAILGRCLSGKEKVYVLVDNLDKAWVPGTNIPSLCEFLYGLLSCSRSIAQEFRKHGAHWESVKLSLVIFLRSDIYTLLLDSARERDKISARRLDWSDKALLLRVVEERFGFGHELPSASRNVWSRYFVATVQGVPTRDYILSVIVPRPRDAIYFCKEALFSAVNRRHIEIDADDIERAEEEYSYYALKSLVDETKVRYPFLEDVLLALAGYPAVVTRPDLEAVIARHMPDSVDVPGVIRLLAEVAFLGYEVRPSDFDFVYDETRLKVVENMATRLAQDTNTQRYQIGRAYHSFLGIMR